MNAVPPSPAAADRLTLQSLWYDAIYVMSMAGFCLGFSLRMTGRTNMPPRGPVLVIANHQSFLDPVAIGLATRRRLVPLARKTLFRNRLFSALIRSLNAVPIDQEGIGKEGIRAIAAQLGLGRAVLVFPEGSRTPDGTLQPFRPGIHLLLKRAPAPIVPVGIAGAYEAWPMWRPYPIPAPLFLPAAPGTIGVAIGRPLDPEHYAELPRDEAMQALSDEVKKVQLRAEHIRRH